MNPPNTTRRWITPLTLVLFAAIGLTGLLMWVHLRVPGLRLLHEVAGLLFVAAGSVHLLLNRRALASCFRERSAWIAFGCASALCVALVVADLARGGQEEGDRGRAEDQDHEGFARPHGGHSQDGAPQQDR